MLERRAILHSLLFASLILSLPTAAQAQSVPNQVTPGNDAGVQPY